MSDERPKCGLCGQPMPKGEEMFQYHGYSGPCPGPCDHDWETVDHSFDHEYGCEQIVVDTCSKCGEERNHDTQRLDDDVI